jgi:opacity protein-like surface antigen
MIAANADRLRGSTISSRSEFLITLSMLVLLLASDAAGQSPTGLYLGAGIGSETLSVECCGGYDFGYLDGDSAIATEFDLGYRVNRHLAAELEVVATAPEWQQNQVYLPDLNDVFNNSVDSDLTIVQLSAIGIMPIGEYWEAYVRGGISFWQGDAAQTLIRISDTSVTRRSLDESGTDLLLAIGIGANLTPAWHLRLEFHTSGIDRQLISANDSTTLDGWRLGFVFRPAARRTPATGADRE